MDLFTPVSATISPAKTGTVTESSNRLPGAQNCQALEAKVAYKTEKSVMLCGRKDVYLA